MALSEDAKRLLNCLPDSGRITNQNAMKLTAWDLERLRKAKFELRDAGLVQVIASFGGPFGRSPAAPLDKPTDSALSSKLSEDARWLLDHLPDSGRITNQNAMNLTDWDFERLRKAKFELRDAGLVEIKASFGGPFGKRTVAAPQESIDTVLSSNEQELYEPLKKWILDEFVPDEYVKGRDLFEVVVSGNKRPKQAKFWEVPDIIGVSFTKYKFIPAPVFKTISFEVKQKSAAFDPYGIFEAISHSKFGTSTYYCFEWPRDDDFQNTNARYTRLEQEAKIHGIGLIQIWFADKEKKRVEGKVHLEARVLSYDPPTLSNFIDKYFPDEVKNRLRQITQSY